MFSLREWQNMIVHKDQIIVQASTTDGCDGQTCTSIGMSYIYAHYPDKTADFQIGNHDQLVLCAIGENTDQRRRGGQAINRRNIIATLKSNGIENVALKGLEYFESLPKYKFVISPEGNGVDCHRHYEALMAGCIPIVEFNPIIQAKYGDVPILYTRDYSEITPTYLEEKYAEMLDRKWDFSRLFLSSWSPEEQMLIKYRGNYWCKELVNKCWY